MSTILRACCGVVLLFGCRENPSVTPADLAAAADLATPWSPDAGAADLGPIDTGDPSMIGVPAGTFRMGCNAAADKQCQADESPDHDVTLHAFAIDRTEVTQAAYQACIDAGACTAPTMAFDPAGHPTFPVNYVKWDQAVDYCTWAGKRLPTEAEWERAARGLDRRVYPWGNEAPDCTRVNYSAAWPQDTCFGATQAVGSHPLGRSPIGAEDMGGNLWEWTGDWYAADYYAHSPAADPQGPATGDHRAKRSGSFGDPADRVRASRRWFHYPFQAEEDIGFRCAKSL